MAQQNEVIVWEWLSDHGRWKCYKPSIVNAIEANSYSCTRFGLGEVDPSMSAYEIDFSSNRQIRLNTGMVRPIRRRTFPENTAPGKGIEWQWQDDIRWSAYDLNAATIIEEAHAQGKASIDLGQTSCSLPYVVDFTEMEQARKDSGFQRKIQRVILNPSYPKVQIDKGSSDNVRLLPGSSTDASLATVPSSAGASSSKESVVICLEKAPSTVTRPNALVAPMPSSASTVISDDVGPETSSSETNLTTATSGVRTSKRLQGKRTGSRKAVAATSGVQATVAWSTPPDSNVTSSSTVSTSGVSLLRSASVPGGTCVGPEVTVASTASTSVLSAGPSTISHSATTSCLVAATAVRPRMTRSQSTPCNITAKPAHAAGVKLSPIMTAITSMLLSTAVPIKLNPAPIPVFMPPPTSRGGIRPVEGVKPSKKKRKTTFSRVPIKLNPAPIPVFMPPPTSRGGIRPVEGVKPSKKKRKTTFSRVDNAEDVLKKYVRKVKKLPDEDCPICYEKLADTSHFSEDNGDDPILNLNKCGHMFHTSCLQAMYNSGPKDGSIQCPTCKTIYGVKRGNQPLGRMDYHVIPHSLPGYPDCGTIRIIYDIPPGTQGEEHPNPGERYSSRGFPRHCYLPDIAEGQKILKLLVVAWERRLIFTIGTSATTGEQSTVVWNEIHHKTEFGSNVTGHGFPDPHYFENIVSELSSQGVTEDCLET